MKTKRDSTFQVEKPKNHKTGRPKKEKTPSYLEDLKIKNRAKQRKFYYKVKDGLLNKDSKTLYA